MGEKQGERDRLCHWAMAKDEQAPRLWMGKKKSRIKMRLVRIIYLFRVSIGSCLIILLYNSG